jgi:UDP-2,3-diacylglucosamine pyrophosphatase LpxH
MEYYKTVFISDVHLGTRRCRVGKFLDFLHAFRADNLYLLGDVIDIWEIGLTRYFPQEHWNALRSILGKAKHGTRIFYVPGNHDQSLKKICPVENMGNVSVVEKADYHTSDGKRFLLIHGDVVDRYLFFRKSPFTKFIADLIYSALTAADFFTRPFFPAHRSLLIILQLALVRLRQYSRWFEAAVIDYGRRRGYDGVICGHDHSPAILEKDGFAYVNCGDWAVNCTAVVEDHAGDFTLMRF